MRCTPHEMHAYEVRAYEIHAPEMQAYETHPHEMHAREVHPYEHWDGPIVLKGIQTVEDALKSVEVGVQGIVVSNHG